MFSFELSLTQSVVGHDVHRPGPAPRSASEDPHLSHRTVSMVRRQASGAVVRFVEPTTAVAPTVHAPFCMMIIILSTAIAWKIELGPTVPACRRGL